MKIAIIIPAYNEEMVISGVVNNLISELKRSKIAADVIVVNDGSKDNTAKEAKRGGAKIINHILNSGAGGATLTGLMYAQQKNYNIIATADADGQHGTNDIIQGIISLQNSNSDLLIGSRLINPVGMSRIKRIGNKGLSILTRLLFGVKSTDSQSGLRIYSRRAIENLRWKSNGFEFCSEMIWRAKQLGLTINEYPISAIYTEYSVSKGQNNWNAINILKSLIHQRFVEMFE
jgi:polyprenyl-phospho-N-acetylgalactosaminyl synthase